MKIAQLQEVEGQTKAVPLPYSVTPLNLSPEVAARIRTLLAHQGILGASAVPAAPPKSMFAGIVGLGSSRPAGAATPMDWSHPLVVDRSVFGPESMLSMIANLPPPSIPAPKPPPKEPKLSARPVTARRIAFDNSSRYLRYGQFVTESLKPLDIPAVQQLGEVLDGAVACQALCELSIELWRPTIADRCKRFLFYSRRLLYIGKFLTNVLHVPRPVQYSIMALAVAVKGYEDVYIVQVE